MSPRHAKLSVYGALFANVAIAVVKFIAAYASRSSSMIAEGIHSLVDSGNEALLLLGMKRSQLPADELHRFGHGKEIYFWSLIVAVLIFGIGGGLSIYEGIIHILHPEPMTDPFWNYVVLGAAMVFEGTSLFIAVRSFLRAGKHREKDFFRSLVRSKDPGLFVVIYEDSAALLGLVIALLGVFSSHYFHLPVLDGVASVLIGLMLATVAVLLVIESRHLLIGESADDGLMTGVRGILAENPSVESVATLKTMHLGPHQILLVLRVNFEAAARIPELTAGLKEKIRQRFPDITEIYLESS